MSNKLIDKLTWLSKRSDLSVQAYQIRLGVNKHILKEKADHLPIQLVELYKKMNGCYFLATARNQADLTLGLTIPPIETIGTFRTAPDLRYNFKEGGRFLPFEWSEPTDSTFFFFLGAGDNGMEDAKIVYARAGEEDRFEFVCDSLDVWMERAIDANFSLGWAIHDSNDYQSRKTKLEKLLKEEPLEAKTHLPGTRLRFDDYRVMVVASICREANDKYFGKDFTLIDFDLGARGWVQSGRLKKIGKIDFYEKIKTGKLPWDMIRGENATKEIAQNFAAICCSNASIGIGPENLFIPYRSSLLVGLFYDLSLEETTELIFSMLDNWFELFDGKLKQEIVFDKAKSMVKLDVFELSNLFHALIGMLAIMIIRVRKSEGVEMGYLRHIQSMLKERLPLYISSCHYEFLEFLKNMDLLFSSDDITADDWFDKKVSPYYVDKIGFDDYPFYLNP